MYIKDLVNNKMVDDTRDIKTIFELLLGINLSEFLKIQDRQPDEEYPLKSFILLKRNSKNKSYMNLLQTCKNMYKHFQLALESLFIRYKIGVYSYTIPYINYQLNSSSKYKLTLQYLNRISIYMKTYDEDRAKRKHIQNMYTILYGIKPYGIRPNSIFDRTTNRGGNSKPFKLSPPIFGYLNNNCFKYIEQIHNQTDKIYDKDHNNNQTDKIYDKNYIINQTEKLHKKIRHSRRNGSIC